MNLTSRDYQRLVSARTEEITNVVWGHDRGIPQAFNNNQIVEEFVPNFERLKQLSTEINELLNEYETSLGPA